MSQNNFLGDLFAQKMSRKDFLVRIGATLLALVGVAGLLKALSGLSHPAGRASNGVTPYGGENHPGGES